MCIKIYNRLVVCCTALLAADTLRVRVHAARIKVLQKGGKADVSQESVLNSTNSRPLLGPVDACCKNRLTGNCWEDAGDGCSFYTALKCSSDKDSCPQRCLGKEVPERSRSTEATNMHKVTFCLDGVHTYIQLPTCCTYRNRHQCMPAMRESGALRSFDKSLPDMSCHCDGEYTAMAEIHYNGAPVADFKGDESLYYMLPVLRGEPTRVAELGQGTPGKCAEATSGMSVITSGSVDAHPVCAWGILTKLKEVYGAQCKDGNSTKYCRTGGLNGEAVLKRGFTNFFKGIGEKVAGCAATLSPKSVLEKASKRQICWGFNKDYYSLYCHWRGMAKSIPSCVGMDKPLNSWSCCEAIVKEQLSKTGP